MGALVLSIYGVVRLVRDLLYCVVCFCVIAGFILFLCRKGRR